MQISRSVFIATTRPSSSRTGTAPQSQSHISRAATAVESVVRTLATCLVIKSRIFMAASAAGKRRLEGDCAPPVRSPPSWKGDEYEVCRADEFSGGGWDAVG